MPENRAKSSIRGDRHVDVVGLQGIAFVLLKISELMAGLGLLISKKIACQIEAMVGELFKMV